MPRNNFLAIALMALLSLLSVGTASANEKKVWISSKVAVNLALGNSLSGQTITFTIMDASGNTLGQATVPAEQALGSSLAQFFQSVADAIKELVGPGSGDNDENAAKNSDEKLQLNQNKDNGSSSGGGSCDRAVASCS